DPHREQALFDQAAVFGARGQLLADIAALLPIDAVQFVKAGFEQDRFLEDEIAAAVGDAERQAMSVITGEIGFGEPGALKRLANLVARQDPASAERRQSGIDKGQPFPERPRRAGLLGQAQRLASAFAEDRRYRKIR